jgi:hypothetical protein
MYVEAVSQLNLITAKSVAFSCYMAAAPWGHSGKDSPQHLARIRAHLIREAIRIPPCPGRLHREAPRRLLEVRVNDFVTRLENLVQLSAQAFLHSSALWSDFENTYEEIDIQSSAANTSSDFVCDRHLAYQL